ncbi:MAG TPA: ABC transporter substrate-binding protein [Thermoleophilaceae bacterium]|nr:ABC transporter substrate-binding protein [Thermoleophilaceae bacterium]
MLRHPRSVLVVLFVLGSLTIAAGCGGDDNNKSSSGKKGSGEPIVFGAAGAKSGTFSAFDGPALEAAQLQIDQINADGGLLGRKLTYVDADTRSQPEQVQAAGVKVLDEGANVMLASCDFDLGAAAALEAQKKGILSMSTCAGSLSFGPKGIGDLAFTMGPAAATHAATMADFAYNKLGAKTAYVLLDDSITYEKELCAAFKERWTELAGKDALLGEDTFKQGDASIRGQLSRIQRLSSPPDFIYQCSYLPGNAQALRQIRAAGIDVPVLAEQTFDGDSWKKAVPNVSNLYFPATASIYGDDPDPAVNKFFKDYEQKTGAPPPSSLALTGAAAVQAIAIAIERSKSLDGAKLAQELLKFDNEKLLVGSTTFSPEFHLALAKDTRIMKVENGKTKFEAIGKINADDVPVEAATK